MLTRFCTTEHVSVEPVDRHQTAVSRAACDRGWVMYCSGTKYSCPECGKSFSLPQNLAIHVTTHRDDQRPTAQCHRRLTSTMTPVYCTCTGIVGLYVACVRTLLQ